MLNAQSSGAVKKNAHKYEQETHALPHLVHGDERGGQEHRQRSGRDGVLQPVPQAHAPSHARAPRGQGGRHVPPGQVEEQAGRVEHVRNALAVAATPTNRVLARGLS